MGTMEDLGWPLRRAVRQGAGREAVVDRGRRLSYADLGRRIAGANGGLRRLGLANGDVVAVLAGNSLEYVEFWLGIPASGFVLNPLNFRLAEAELEFIVNDSGARAIIADARFFPVAERLAALCPKLDHLIWADIDSAPGGVVSWADLVDSEPAELDVDLTPDTLAAISYTGGTTGLPKGVMQSHRNLVANAHHVLIGLPLSGADRFLHAAPMFHAAGACNVFSLTSHGGTHVVLPQFDPGEFCSLVERERATATVIVPTMLAAIVNHPTLGGHDLGSWRTMGLGASPPPLELLARAVEVLPCDIRQLYGATETSPHVCSTPAGAIRRWVIEGNQDRLRSCGVADIGVEVEIHDLVDGTPCADGEVGEVWIRGANVMAGYLNRPEETAKALTGDGWYRSGDLGSMDTDGYLYLVDRAKDMIITGGENVYTTEVENAIYRHPAVLEAAVFGIPDERWGEAVHAVVVTRPGSSLEADELIASCRQYIAGYKVPRTIEIRTDPLPKSGANKILKRDLRAPFWGG